MNKSLLALTVVSAIIFEGCTKNNYNDTPKPPAAPQATVVKASGDLTSALAEFRHLLGDNLNAAPGNSSGRREVNWDAVPPAFTNSNNFPFDFFNSTDPAAANGRKRGLVLTNTGTSFRVDSTNFSDIEPTYNTQFAAFSPKRLFTYIGSTITGSTFKVPGTSTDAFIKGFGVVFSDVDVAGSSTIEYFEGTKSLGVFQVPVAQSGNSFSFPGRLFSG